MYELMSLKLKCPECGESLMDHEHQIDNEPGIKLRVTCNEKAGTIWLSSIYGSYNYAADIELLQDCIVSLNCPHCDEHLISTSQCLACGAPMIPLFLDIGGRVSICSRVGCKNHFVEFDDLSLAMKRLYQDYGYAGKGMKRPSWPEVRKEPEKRETDETAEILETGTFLQSYCPHCKKSLIEDDMLKVKITNGEEGVLMLSPYFNVFSSKSTIYLSEDKTVKDLKCIHCDTSLIVEDRVCETCKSPVAKINISARTKLIDFYICTRKGCKWHGLNEDDLYNIRLEDSLEW